MFDQFKDRAILDALVRSRFLLHYKHLFRCFSLLLARPSGGPQPMSRNSDSYINRNQNRNQSSTIKRSLPANNNNNNNDQHQPYGTNNRDRIGSVNNGSNNNDRHRSSPVRRSRSRTNKMITPKRTSRPPAPKYTCTLPKASLDRYKSCS